MNRTEQFYTGTYEGKQDQVRNLALPSIEVFQNIYPDRNYRIDMEIPEFTAICPKTGLPDFGTILLSYRPNEFCLELKSLKEYVTAYRDIGIFHENVVNRMLDDLVKACQPRWLRLHGDYNVRGGIKTRVTATYTAPI
ncbi:MAG: preQ(1) synthase [Leptospiraceae bacterium]